MPIAEIGVGINLPGFAVSTKWVPNDAERTAAWELLVELVTRTTVTPLGPDEGVLREALTSVYSLFGVTREVLRRNGPEVARDKGNGNPSLATIAAVILNTVLRPLLSTWHPALTACEAERPVDVGAVQWERQWSQAPELRQALNDVRQVLRNYIDVLGEAAGTVEFAHAVDPRPSDE